RRGPVRVMAELSDRIPEGVWLTSLETNGATIKLSGESLDNELVALFLHNLSEPKYFTDADLDATKPGGTKKGLKLVHFDVKASLAGSRPDAAAEGAKAGAKRPARAAARPPTNEG